MKIKMATLRKLAQAEGYTGDANDPEAMKSFLVTAGVTKIQLNGGEPVEVKMLQCEQTDDRTVVVRQVDDAAPEGESAKMEDDPKEDDEEKSAKFARDLDAKVKATVDARMKAAGFAPDRPTAGVSIGVQPVIESWYENRIKSGRAAFKTVKSALQFRDRLVRDAFGQVGQYVNHPEVAKARKAFEPGGIWTKAGYATTPTAAGGALVATEFYADIIANLDEYGVSRKLSQVVPMNTDKLTRPRKVGRHAVSYPDENAAATQSTAVSYLNVTLQAKTGVVLVQASRQIVDDASGSGIAYLDDVAWDLARAFAYQEDLMLLTAAGEAAAANTFGHIGRLAALGYGTAAGLVPGGGDMTAHSDANIESLIATLPTYAIPGAVFTCSPQAAARIFLRLAQGKGGVTYEEAVNGGRVMKYHGIPVITNNLMNTVNATGTNTVDVLYGDFTRSSMIGDRMSLEIMFSDQVYFENNAIGIRAVMRHDVNVYDVGDASDAGPVVGLYQT